MPHPRCEAPLGEFTRVPPPVALVMFARSTISPADENLPGGQSSVQHDHLERIAMQKQLGRLVPFTFALLSVLHLAA